MGAAWPGCAMAWRDAIGRIGPPLGGQEEIRGGVERGKCREAGRSPDLKKHPSLTWAKRHAKTKDDSSQKGLSQDGPGNSSSGSGLVEKQKRRVCMYFWALCMQERGREAGHEGAAAARRKESPGKGSHEAREAWGCRNRGGPEGRWMGRGRPLQSRACPPFENPSACPCGSPPVSFAAVWRPRVAFCSCTSTCGVWGYRSRAIKRMRMRGRGPARKGEERRKDGSCSCLVLRFPFFLCTRRPARPQAGAFFESSLHAGLLSYSPFSCNALALVLR